MAYLGYPDSCLDDDSVHVCDPCAESDLARVRGIAFRKKSFNFVDITDPAEWAAAMLSGDIDMIPEVNGEFDGGTPTYGIGVGDVPQTLESITYKITFNDYNIKSNRDFYNKYNQVRDRIPIWRSETVLMEAAVPASIFGKSPIVNDDKARRYWIIEVTFIQRPLPTETDIPENTFVCTEVVE